MGADPLVGRRPEDRRFAHQRAIGNGRDKAVVSRGDEEPPLPHPSRRLLRVAKGREEKAADLLSRQDDQPFAFAGLWERWSRGAEPVESCTILTTTANALVQPYHDRMPVILSPNDYNPWLDPETTDAAKLNYLFEPCPVEELTAYPVNPVVNNARHDGADCIEAV
jgi:putative SOS response-associated peptidase YedK